MVGGDENTLKDAEGLLKSMGSRWVYCGTAGMGLIAKICNNMILGMTMMAVAEAMHLGVKYVNNLIKTILLTQSSIKWHYVNLNIKSFKMSLLL